MKNLEKQFCVTGMSCAACSAHVQKAVESVPGVKSANVNLLTSSMSVESENNFDDNLVLKIVESVKKSGYGASLKEKSFNQNNQNSNQNNNTLDKSNSKNNFNSETKILFKRFLISLLLLLPLMYVSMGVGMWNAPLPSFVNSFLENLNQIENVSGVKNNFLSDFVLGVFQAVVALLILIINKKFFVSGAKAVLNKSPNMDTLVALGAGVSYVYSLFNLIFSFVQNQKMIHLENAPLEMINSIHQIQQISQVHQIHQMPHFYFESAAMIVTLITIGKMLESFSKGKTTSALNSLIDLAPQKATLLSDKNGVQEEIVDVESLKIGDIVVVKTGESIPIDGVIIEGAASINESNLTGESIPVDKKIGEEVFASTLCVTGRIVVKTTKTSDETSFAKIIQLVTDASSSKAPIAKVADKVSAIFVPAVLLISLITFVVWFLISRDFSKAINFAVCVLVISCPCSLGLATPVSIMVGNGVAARHGILFKTASALEATSKIEVCVMDKTGTVTNGTPVVTDVVSLIDKTEFLQYAFLLEKNSSHPLAKSIALYCDEFLKDENNLKIQNEKKSSNKNFVATDFTEIIGSGVQAFIDGKKVKAGNEKFILEDSDCKIIEDENLKNQISLFAENGKTPILFSVENQFAGIICLSDTEKKSSFDAIRALEKNHIETILLTGDNEKTANAIASRLNIKKVFANVKPDQKEKVVAKLSESKKVAMVGDGVNDAPSLKRAFVGIAVGAGTDVALDAADIVLLKNDLLDVVRAIKISHATLKNIHENLFWAFFYNAICIPVAAGALSHFGIVLVPMFGALAMSLSSFCVVMNALRLNFVKIGEKIMKAEKTVKIEGMMCEHCQRHVKDALEKIGLTADVDHKAGTAKVSGDASDEEITKAVTDAGYKVVEII